MTGIKKPQNFSLGDLSRLMWGAARAGQPVREMTIDKDGQIRLVMAPEGPIGPPTQGDLAAEVAEMDALVAADKPAGPT